MKPALSSRRVLIVGSLLVLFMLGLSSLFDSEPAAAARPEGVGDEAGVRQVEAELAVTQAQRDRAAVKELAVEFVEEGLDEDFTTTESEETVWQLIEQLGALAQEPESYHELALPVIEKIGLACSEASLAEEVFQQVVVNGMQPDFVRGGVLIGMSVRVDEAAFDSLLLSWFGVNEASPELLRAAAMAAAFRGEKSYCSLPVDFGYLAKLQGDAEAGGVRLPGIYPLRIDRIPGPGHLELLRGWIEAAEVAASQLEGSAAETDPAAIGEFFVSAEVLFAVWGLAGLKDASVEAVVLSRAFVSGHEEGTEGLVYLRVANFLVHSLAPCNDRMFDLSVQMAASENPVTAALASSMSGHLSAGIGVALLSKIEGVRYSEEPGSSAELAGYLLDIGDGLASIADPYDLEQALLYVDGIIQDSMVDALARAIGLKTLGEHAPWDSFFVSAADALQAGAPEEIHAIALSSLVELAGSDARRRAQVIELLEETREFTDDDRVRLSLGFHIERLSQ